MFDELKRLRDNNDLFRLLDHYNQAGVTDQEAWQDRVMELQDVEATRLVRLHGELLAFGWIDQNTGSVPILKMNAVPRCYRLTAAGRRALRRAQRLSDQDNEDEALAA